MIEAREALKKLIEGNKRFAQGESSHPNMGQEVRDGLINEQKPFAVILACSDSRVPVEIIFDVGIGDLFVIRSAGHVMSKEALGSIEYAVGQLGVKLVMILGHDNCGAVESALNVYKSGKYDELSGNLKVLMNHIYPVFDKMEKSCKNSLDAAIDANIKYQLQDLLSNDPYLASRKDKNFLLVGARYNFETGLVDVRECLTTVGAST